MINVKHLMDDVEDDDGKRLWVEPVNLTRDLCHWCEVDFVVPEVGPCIALWNWFEQHPDGYEYFRGRYHEMLCKSPLREALQLLANVAVSHNITLLHQGIDPEHNTATALYEFLSELSAYSPPDA